MRSPTATRLSLAARAAVTLLAALAVGCADATTPSSPERDDAADAPSASATSVSAAAQDTARSTTQTPSQTTQRADTTRPTTYPASVRVSGRLLVTVWTPGRTVADTLTGFEPRRGARITLYRNVLVDGRGVSQRIAERETGADGSFVFEGVPGGPYVLALNVTPERFYGEHVWYLMGNAAEVSTTLRLWTRSAAPADSTRGP